MTLTKADLRDRIGGVMGLVQAGSPLSGEHAGIIERAIDDAHALLEESEIAYWDLTAIPQQLAIPLRDYVVGVVFSEVGATADINVMSQAEAYETLLRLCRNPKGERVRADRSLLRMSATRFR